MASRGRQPSTSVQSPKSDYDSCNEDPQPSNDVTVDLDKIFKEYNVSPPIEDISYSLANAIDFVYYDSNAAIAIYPGCVRFGTVIAIPSVNNLETSFLKDKVHEMPIFSVRGFVKQIYNFFSFFFSNQQEPKEILLLQKNQVKEFAVFGISNGVKWCSFKLLNSDNTHEIKFDSAEELLRFSKKFESILISITSPTIFQHDCVTIFVEKLSDQPNKTGKEIFQFWLAKKKMKILFNGVATAVDQIDKEKIHNERFMFYIFNFFKSNLEIVYSLYLLNIIHKTYQN